MKLNDSSIFFLLLINQSIILIILILLILLLLLILFIFKSNLYCISFIYQTRRKHVWKFIMIEYDSYFFNITLIDIIFFDYIFFISKFIY